MKNIWTEDAETIQQEMYFLVENKIELICGRKGVEAISKLTVIGKTTTKKGPIFVLHHPMNQPVLLKHALFIIITRVILYEFSSVRR